MTSVHSLTKAVLFSSAGLFANQTIAALPPGGGAGVDNCADAMAVPLSDGGTITFGGDNSTATSTGDFVAGSVFEGAPVLWHSFTTTECMNVSLNYCGQAPAWGNTLGILATTCPADEVVFTSAFNNTDCGDGNSTYWFTSLDAGTYYVPVLLDAGANAVGPYLITLNGVACSNDLCTDVEPIPLLTGTTLNFSGDNTLATAVNDFAPGSVYNGAPVTWHAFTTTSCSYIVMSYCGLAPAWNNVFGVLMMDCPGDETNAVSAVWFNDTDCGDGNRSFGFEEVPPGTYYFPVLLDEANNSVGPYTISLSATSCGIPDNDQCQDVTAEPLPLGTSITFTGDNSTATAMNDFVESSVYAGAPVAWHAFTLQACTDLMVEYCGQSPAWLNTFGILSVTCPGDSVIVTSAFNTTDCGDGNSTYSFLEVAAGTYYLPVLNDPGNNSSGAYAVTVTANSCSPLSIVDGRSMDLRIFPNPGTGAFTLNNNGSLFISDLELVDLSGRIVRSIEIDLAPHGSAVLDLSGTSSGVYLIRLIGSDQEIFEQRLIIQ